MEFFSAYNPKPTVPSPEGSPFQPVYERRVQKDGTLELEVVSTKNIQHEINEGCVGLTPYEVLDRYARTPDPEILKQMEKSYADFTAVPRTLAELEQFRIDCRGAFDALPHNVRQLFDNNFNVFMQNPGAFDELLRGIAEKGKNKASAASGGEAAEAVPETSAGTPIPAGTVAIK